MYKVEFNKSELQNKTIPGNSKCVLPISLSACAYKQPKLGKILKLINNDFKECTIILGDYLNRWNYLSFPQFTKEDFENKCLNQGEEWISENAVIYSKYTADPF